MALTVSTNYKSNTVASVSGTTFTSNGTPFVSGDVGRYIRLTSGAGLGSIRKITAYTSSKVVTVDLAWNSGYFAADGVANDSAPSSGNSWVMNNTLADLANGVDIIASTSQLYRVYTVSLTNTAFIADIGKSFTFDSTILSIANTACCMWGEMSPNGYPRRSCTLTDTSTASSPVVFNGDWHVYGGSIQVVSTTDAQNFWRLYRGSDHIARIVGVQIYGLFGMRIQGSKSLMRDCDFISDTSTFGSFGPLGELALIKNCRSFACLQMIRWAYDLGVGTVTGPRFKDTTNSVYLLIASGTPTNRAGTIIDYVKSEIVAAPVNAANTGTGLGIDWKQTVATSVVNSVLAAITDSTRQVIKKADGTTLVNQTSTSGTFATYTALVNQMRPTSTGNQTWGGEGQTLYGPFTQVLGSYLYQVLPLVMSLDTSFASSLTLVSDTGVTQTTKATVDAYTSISTYDQLYDRAKSWTVDNLDITPTFGVPLAVPAGVLVDFGALNVTANSGAGSVLAVSGSTVTVKSSVFGLGTKFSGIKTTGIITAALTTGGAYTYTNGTITGTTALPTFAGGTLAPTASASCAFNSTGTLIIKCTPTGAGSHILTGTHTGTLDLRNLTAYAITVQVPAGTTTTTASNVGGTITVTNPAITLQILRPNIINGSNYIVRNVTTDTDLASGTTSGGTGVAVTLTKGTHYSSGDTLSLRIGYCVGAVAKLPISETLTAPALDSINSAPTTQDAHTAYNSIAIDGSTRTEFAADYVENDVNVVIGADFYGQNFMAWWVYNEATVLGLKNFLGVWTLVDEANMRNNTAIGSSLIDITVSTHIKQIDNVRIFRDDGAYPVKQPSTGGGTIDVNWRNSVLVAIAPGSITAAEIWNYTQ